MTQSKKELIALDALRFLRLTAISFAVFATLPGVIILLVEVVI